MEAFKLSLYFPPLEVHGGISHRLSDVDLFKMLTFIIHIKPSHTEKQIFDYFDGEGTAGSLAKI